MVYRIAHLLRDKLPFIWDVIDMLNSLLFGLRYGRKLKSIEPEISERYGKECGLTVVPLSEVKTDDLVAFFNAQPDEAFTFFRPHKFDEKSLRKLQRNKSFLGYVFVDAGRIAAYCFIRSFFIGKGFRGRMVGVDYRGKGLGTLMNRFMNEIGFGIGLRLFETVSKKNVASYRSALSASDVKVVEEMENDELYLEIIDEKGKEENK